MDRKLQPPPRCFYWTAPFRNYRGGGLNLRWLGVATIHDRGRPVHVIVFIDTVLACHCISQKLHGGQFFDSHCGDRNYMNKLVYYRIVNNILNFGIISSDLFFTQHIIQWTKLTMSCTYIIVE